MCFFLAKREMGSVVITQAKPFSQCKMRYFTKVGGNMEYIS